MAKQTSKRSSGKSSTKTSRASRGSGKRELIKPKGDARFVRRDGGGQFKESDDMGRSLKQDRRTKSKTKAKSGYGDRGDR
jgi:hypothetical protein